MFSSTVLETLKKSFSEYFLSFADSLDEFPLLKNQSVGIGLYSLAQPPEISGKLDLSLFLPPTDPAPPRPAVPVYELSVCASASVMLSMVRFFVCVCACVCEGVHKYAHNSTLLYCTSAHHPTTTHTYHIYTLPHRYAHTHVLILVRVDIYIYRTDNHNK